MGIVSSKADASLFIYIEGSLIMYVHVHVDDILVSGNSSYTVASLNHDLGSAFAIKDLGPLHYFLGMEVSKLVLVFICLELSMQSASYTVLALMVSSLSPHLLSLALSCLSLSALHWQIQHYIAQLWGPCNTLLSYAQIFNTKLITHVSSACPKDVHWSTMKCILRCVNGNL